MRHVLTPVILAAASALAQTSTPQPANPPRSAMAPTPNTDLYYRMAADAFPQDGVPQGEIKGPFTLPSQAYPGTQHTYWVYVPAQYDPAVPASLMIYNDGQAFMAPEGDIRAQVVMDNLIYRREIPVMIGSLHQSRPPARSAGAQLPRNGATAPPTGPTEYNTLDDKYARVIVDELLPVLYKEYNISKDPERHGIGGSSSGAIAAFTVAWERPNDLPQGAEQRRQLHQYSRRKCVSGYHPQQRQEALAHFPGGWAQR